jgi:hypothetical protein
MKPWLRLTLITISVGGGFTGFALTFQALQSGLSSHTEPLLNLLIMGIFLLLNAGVAASGLLFVHDPECTRPLAASLAIQVPWISSPFLTYRFASGLELILSVLLALRRGKTSRFTLRGSVLLGVAGCSLSHRNIL